jgi:hypothetical protein
MIFLPTITASTLLTSFLKAGLDEEHGLIAAETTISSDVDFPGWFYGQVVIPKNSKVWPLKRSIAQLRVGDYSDQVFAIRKRSRLFRFKRLLESDHQCEPQKGIRIHESKFLIVKDLFGLGCPPGIHRYCR